MSFIQLHFRLKFPAKESFQKFVCYLPLTEVIEEWTTLCRFSTNNIAEMNTIPFLSFIIQ